VIDLKQMFWTLSVEKVLQQMKSNMNGLSSIDAKKRLTEYGANSIKQSKRNNAFYLLLAQFKSPIIIILFFAIGLSFYLHDTLDAFIILAIVLASGVLGFWQEYGANSAVEKLLSVVQIKATVLRDGKQITIDIAEIVPGDIVIMEAGDIVAGDSLIIESNSLFIDEAALTGETFPVEKEVGILLEETAINDRKNCLWMGTHIISGSVKAVVINTGKNTEFGKISESLKTKSPETEFERGVKSFGYLLMEITLILVFAIFAINVLLKRPALDSFLFSLALAVGLTPQLLPAIISINLANGAKMMAKAKVIVKRLSAIENFGSMDVFCSDKTGTITDGVVKLQSALNINGNVSEKVLLYAFLNASFETGFINPIDQAIRSYKQLDIKSYLKLDEQPYDFIRKRLSILVSETKSNAKTMITKGALQNVLAVCTGAETNGGDIVDISIVRDEIQKQFEEYSKKGYRTLGVAYRVLDTEDLIEKDHEVDMTFLGFITLFDPLKPNIIETVASLKKLGIALKIITGDNRLIAAHVVSQFGMSDAKILTGPEMNKTSDAALIKKVADITVFAEVEPNQKERIIIALRKAGFVVGYMGDGINDASALHAADVSISVDSAVDVAKEAADIVLLEKDLNVLISGVTAGRITFANTLKYVFMATSANFGNMFSMAGASLFLPFLPLLPKQILLTNLLTDFPEMTIASDSVDHELIMKPRRWDIHFIQKFMLVFGLISSIFDYLTFGVFVLLLHSSDVQFRTGWFLESVCSAALIVLVIRSRKPLFKSVPGKYLTITTFLVVVVTLIIPYTPLSGLLGFQPLPVWILLVIGAIVTLYIVTAEIAKKFFYKIVKY
jgi:Mg2+-importing ATPase